MSTSEHESSSGRRLPLAARMALQALVFAAIAAVWQFVTSFIFESRPPWNTTFVVVLAVVGALFAVYDHWRRDRRAREAQSAPQQ